MFEIQAIISYCQSNPMKEHLKSTAKQLNVARFLTNQLSVCISLIFSDAGLISPLLLLSAFRSPSFFTCCVQILLPSPFNWDCSGFGRFADS